MDKIYENGVSQLNPNLGPDRIIATENVRTSDPDGVIRIHKFEESKKPISVYSFFKQISTKYKNRDALICRREGEDKKWTYQEYFDDACCCARSFIKLGLDRFHGVCIMGFNSPEWLISSYGSMFAGGYSVGIYGTNSAEASLQIAENCQAQIVVVENKTYLDKFIQIKDKLPHLKALIQWRGEIVDEGVLSWSQLMEIGRNESSTNLTIRLESQAVNQCCALIYTSGTTGPSKGVMLNQDQVTWAAKKYNQLWELVQGKEVAISYLPMSHIAGLLLELFINVQAAATIHFAPHDALKGTLVQCMKEVQPTFFMGVPRVWEKIYEKMQDAGTKASQLKKTIGSWAKSVTLAYYDAMEKGKEPTAFETLKYYLAKNYILHNVKLALGLSRVHHMGAGGAPISREILKYFLSLDLPVMELYAMSESTALCSINICSIGEFKVGSVGKPNPFNELKIQKGDFDDEGGEICMRGRHVCMGYLRNQENTEEAIDTEGWLHTGDLGIVDSDGFLHITGRSKELVITAGGENIPPVFIENVIKQHLPCISNAVLVGDKRKYLTMLLTFKSELNQETGEPTQDLTPATIQWLKEKGCQLKTVEEVRMEIEKNPKNALTIVIQTAFDVYNKKHAISNAQKVQKWRILPHEFSLATGELNNTLKMKRSYILKKYSDVIENMYNA